MVGQPSLPGDGQRSPGGQGLVVSGAGGGHREVGLELTVPSALSRRTCSAVFSQVGAWGPPSHLGLLSLTPLAASSPGRPQWPRQVSRTGWPLALCLLPWGPGSRQLGCHHGGTRGQGLFLSFLFFLGLFLSEGVRQWRGLCADLGLCSQGSCGLRQAWCSPALPSALVHNDGGRAGVLST